MSTRLDTNLLVSDNDVKSSVEKYCLRPKVPPNRVPEESRVQGSKAALLCVVSEIATAMSDLVDSGQARPGRERSSQQSFTDKICCAVSTYGHGNNLVKRHLSRN
jgi:hypothetical protein